MSASDHIAQRIRAIRDELADPKLPLDAAEAELKRLDLMLQAQALGGDPDESMAYIDLLVAKTSLDIDEASSLVFGRLTRGEPIRGCR